MSDSSSISAAVSYSLKDDFSTVSNPNEVWSYNYGGAPVGPQDAGYIIGWGPASDMNGSIARVVSGGWHDAVPGDIVLHAPNSGTHSVTWTSPSDGIITITGKAWDAYFYSDRDCSWFLKVDGTTVAERGTVYGLYRSDTAADFASNVVLGQSLAGISVGAGSVVEFSTYRNTYYGHFVGTELNIGLTSVPEPSAISLMLLGGTTLLRRTRRFRRVAHPRLGEEGERDD